MAAKRASAAHGQTATKSSRATQASRRGGLAEAAGTGSKRGSGERPARKGTGRSAASKSAASKSAASKSAANEVASKRPARKPAKPGKAAHASQTGALFEKVAFMMLSVSDPTRARAFYEEVLGLQRGLASPDGTWTEYDLPGGGCLALFRHPNPKAARAPGGGASVALEVTDLDALNARLKPLGVVYEGDVVRGPHCRMSNILDSEGNSLILHQLDRS